MNLPDILDAFMRNLSSLSDSQASLAFSFSFCALFATWSILQSAIHQLFLYRTAKIYSQERQRILTVQSQAWSSKLHDLLQAIRFSQEQTMEHEDLMKQIVQILERKSAGDNGERADGRARYPASNGDYKITE